MSVNRYPIFYFLTLLPIAIVRFSTMNGHRASLEATIFADSVYQLSGMFNLDCLALFSWLTFS